MTIITSSAAQSNKSKGHSPLRNSQREVINRKSNQEDYEMVGKSTESIKSHDQQSPLHIVLVTETWTPDVNGVSLSLNQLMGELNKMGHTISLIKPKSTNVQGNKDNGSQGFIAHLLAVKGMPIPRYPDLQFGMPAYHSIRDYLLKLQPDVVHIATEGPLGLAALIAAKRLGIKATTGYHTQFHDFSSHFGLGIISRPLMAYFKRFHNWSAATCVPSAKTRKDLTDLGFKRIIEVGRGVDVVRFNPDKRSESLRQSWGAGQQHTVLMMVSRLSPEKGVDVVIRAYQALQLQQLNRATKLVIVGDGPDRSRLESLTQGSDEIIFAGAQTGETLAEYYASGDAFVFASQVETFGNVVTEAMASGLPVYAFDDAAAAMLVDEQCGGLAGFGDIQGFIEMVSTLPKNQQLKQLGSHARQKVLGMSWGRPAQQMLTMFKEVLGDAISDATGNIENNNIDEADADLALVTLLTMDSNLSIENDLNKVKKSAKLSKLTDSAPIPSEVTSASTSSGFSMADAVKKAVWVVKKMTGIVTTNP